MVWARCRGCHNHDLSLYHGLWRVHEVQNWTTSVWFPVWPYWLNTERYLGVEVMVKVHRMGNMNIVKGKLCLVFFCLELASMSIKYSWVTTSEGAEKIGLEEEVINRVWESGQLYQGQLGELEWGRLRDFRQTKPTDKNQEKSMRDIW